MAVSFDQSVWRTRGRPRAPLVSAAGARKSGALAGETVAVKDLYAVTGHRVGAGVPEFLAEQKPATESAAAVQMLLDAGADVTGIAQTDQFAYSLAGQNAAYGTPMNPVARGCIPGGSTSGPSVAVSSGKVSIGLGTDTAGSIRVPTSYQSLFGLRSSHGLVSKKGLLELAPSFDTVGWLTRDRELMQLVTEAMVPVSDRATPDIRRVCVAPILAALAEPFIGWRVTAAAQTLATTLNVRVEEWSLDQKTLESWFGAFRTVQAFEAWQIHGQWILEHPNVLGADVASRFAAASGVTAEHAAAARHTVDAAASIIREVVADSVLVIPAASSGPPSIDASAETVDLVRNNTLRLTCIAGLGGLPALSMPFKEPSEPECGGAPGNVCLIGAPHTDVQLVTLAFG